MPELDIINLAISDLVQHVALLDKLGTFNDGDYHEIDGEEWTGDHLLRVIAAGISTVVAARHSTGSWYASHVLRRLSDDDVALLLTAYGAATGTIEQHTERLRRIISSNAAKGGA